MTVDLARQNGHNNDMGRQTRPIQGTKADSVGQWVRQSLAEGPRSERSHS